jgi:TonB family protein
MADTKALFTQRFAAARAALTAGDEPAAAESLHAAIVVARSEPGLRLELASALFQLGKLSRKFGRAGEAEAELLLTEALTISQELFGREHAALAPLLNELGRLHIHRSQYAGAADILERLLAIARAKGDENVDVATALAGLAVVKRKLGDDESAETLYRDALRIREKVLEPNHMATVVTREHLSETCAARGNFAEALELLRRALATREVALGPGHATVQAARSRVAELELQVAVAADTAAATAAKAARGAIPTPAWLKRVPAAPVDRPSPPLSSLPLSSPPLSSSPVSSPTLLSPTVPSPTVSSPAAPSLIISKEPEFVSEAEPRTIRPAALSRDRATPTVTAAVAAASLMASSIQMPSASQMVISPPVPERAPASGSSAGRESSGPNRDAVLAYIAQIDVASDQAAPEDSQPTIAATAEAEWLEPARKKRTTLYVSAGVAAAAIVIAGLLMARPRTTAAVAPVAKAPATMTKSTAAGTAAVVVVGATHADSHRVASTASPQTTPVVQAEQSASEPASPELRLPRVDVHLRPINVPKITVPGVSSAPSFDSIARSTAERPRASDTDRTGAGERASATLANVDIAVTPAKIIGRVPEPVFPDALLRAGRREGQVLVRFIVNEAGSVDVSTMIVERSDDDLFTSAVRDILPRFHFEPARTHAPESKPVSSWVSVPFRFTTTKK